MTPFNTATVKVFCTEILNQKICCYNLKNTEFHHLKLQILDWPDSLTRDHLLVQLAVLLATLHQKSFDRNLTERNATSGALALWLSSCSRELHHFTKKTISHSSNKSKRASMILMLKLGKLFRMRPRISSQKFYVPTQKKESHLRACLNTHG